MKKFFEAAEMQNHPLRAILDFIEQEKSNEAAKKYEDLRFVGYVLEIGYDTVTIITSDPFKLAVGGVPRGSFLIMLPSNYENLPPHFTLLRVTETAPTPLSKEVQQTYFELQKKSGCWQQKSHSFWSNSRWLIWGLRIPASSLFTFSRVEIQNGAAQPTSIEQPRLKSQPLLVRFYSIELEFNIKFSG